MSRPTQEQEEMGYEAWLLKRANEDASFEDGNGPWAEIAPDAQRAAYLQKRCTCGSGLADGLCVNCWPQ